MVRYLRTAYQEWRCGGIRNLSKAIYRKSQLLYLDYVPLNTSLKMYKTIGETTSTFRIRTKRELRRVDNLMGEEHMIEEILELLDTDDIFYDVGANIGCYAAFTGQHCETVAFEPHPENTISLEQNIDLSKANVDVFQLALSDESGTIPLTVSESGVPGEGQHSLGEEGDAINVETRIGDELIQERNVKPPTILKLDVEGAEGEVLRGLTQTLEQKDCHTIYCELHPQKMAEWDDTPEGIQEFLKNKGFTIEEIPGERHHIHIKATK